jgi:hypothetical protein
LQEDLQTESSGKTSETLKNVRREEKNVRREEALSGLFAGR